MDYTALMILHHIPDKDRKELVTFYQYLILKYKHKDATSNVKPNNRFDGFISKSIKTDHFEMFNREERNERKGVC